jgi:hypothetical protein
MRRIRGPTLTASTAHPIAADPTHHHAAKPLRNPAAAAPMVEPPPMLAASNVAASIPGPRARPATKKSLDPRSRRATHTPSPTCASE